MIALTSMKGSVMWWSWCGLNNACINTNDFRKADWDNFKLLTNKATRTLPSLDNTDLDTSYKAFCSMLTNAAK